MILVFLIHLASLSLAGLGILMADSSAVGWLLGKRRVVSRRVAIRSHWIVSIGLAGLILSGLFMFWPSRTYLMGETVFWIKMAFVTALVINSFFIEYLMHTATRRSFTSLSRGEKVPFILSGGISTLSWLGAFTAAFFLF